MVLLCELFNHQEFVFSPLSKCVVCDIFMSWCLFSHPNLVWPLRDWFVGCILTDNSSRRQRWRRWRGRALWCAPWHPHAPRTVANLTVCLGQIWICQFLISKHTHIDTHAHTQLNTHTGGGGRNKRRRWRTWWLFKSLFLPFSQSRKNQPSSKETKKCRLCGTP